MICRAFVSAPNGFGVYRMEPRGCQRHRRAARESESSGANESNALQVLSRGTATRLQHFSKRCFVDNFYAEFFCLIEFATRFGTGEYVIGFLAHAAGDVAAE